MTNTNNPIDISIIIVNYNTGEMLCDCIKSILEFIKNNIVEIIIYDNNSIDNSIKIAEDITIDKSFVTFIKGQENLGFSKANNLAAKHAHGKWLHFLNPDIIINSKLDEDYSEILKKNNESIYVTSLIDTDGQLQKTMYLIPTLNNYFTRLINQNKLGHWSIGASVIIHRSTFKLLNGWAEDYFMYAEDLDLFYNAYTKNIPVTYLDTRITHIGKASSNKTWSNQQRSMIIESSYKKIFKKHGIAYQYYIIRTIQLFYILLNEPKEFILASKTFLKTIVK